MGQFFLKEQFPGKGDIAVLREFVRQADENCLTEFTWTAYNGDQREAPQLTLTAKEAGS